VNVLGVEVPELPAGYVPLEIVVLVRALNEEGRPALAVRYSEGITSWEAVGMLRAAARLLLHRTAGYGAAEATELRSLVDGFEEEGSG